MDEIVDDMYRCVMENDAFLKAIVDIAIDIDGRKSTEMTIFSPLFPCEEAPAGTKSKVRNFAE